MKKGIVFLALALVALSHSSLLAQPRRGGFQAREHGWVFSLEEGKSLARESGKPLMVVVRCEP